MDFLLHHKLERSAQQFPNKEALVCANQRLSYREVAQKAAGLGRGLRQAGIQKGDRVGIYLPPSVPQVLSIYGISHSGGIFVPISPLLFPQQVAHIARDCQIKTLITTASRLATLTHELQQLPSLEFIVIVTDGEPPEQPLPTHDFETLCEQPPLTRTETVAIAQDLAALLYTSGSTGQPKGVMLSHAQLMAGTEIVSDYLAIEPSDRILAILPFSFDAGLNQLTTAFAQGATLVMMTFIFAREIVQTLAKENITALAGVPTLWTLIVQPNAGLKKQPFPHLRYITNTGGALPENILSDLRTSLPNTQIFLMYGLTEAFRSTYLPPEEIDRRPTSIGKAIPNTEILVINEQGKPCQRGEIGELVHRGPTVSMGYWQQPELTSQRLRPHPLLPPGLAEKEQVCYSGDLVRCDEDGFLYFVGRLDSLIKSSGFRLSPTEVEAVLMRSDWLQATAVIGIADEMLGQAVKAFVVPKDDVELEVKQLVRFCAEHLPRYMVPKQVEVLPTLPTTVSGKVDYPTLRLREVQAA